MGRGCVITKTVFVLCENCRPAHTGCHLWTKYWPVPLFTRCTQEESAEVTLMTLMTTPLGSGVRWGARFSLNPHPQPWGLWHVYGIEPVQNDKLHFLIS